MNIYEVTTMNIQSGIYKIDFAGNLNYAFEDDYGISNYILVGTNKVKKLRYDIGEYKLYATSMTNEEYVIYEDGDFVLPQYSYISYRRNNQAVSAVWGSLLTSSATRYDFATTENLNIFANNGDQSLLSLSMISEDLPAPKGTNVTLLLTLTQSGNTINVKYKIKEIWEDYAQGNYSVTYQVHGYTNTKGGAEVVYDLGVEHSITLNLE